jgi:hypothetical protein
MGEEWCMKESNGSGRSVDHCLYPALARPAALCSTRAKVAYPCDRAPMRKTFRTYLESAGQTQCCNKGRKERKTAQLNE